MKFALKTVFLFLLILNLNNGICKNPEIFKLPSGPEGPGRFGAYYTHLKYDPAWDKDWRVADHPDVVVRFENGGHKFIFWRGTSYIPCWVTENGIWYTNEFVERRGIHSPNTEGCVEPMSDKQCRYSHVRIIENNDARVVIHWRYAPIDVNYEHPFIDQKTGWFDWVDEYYVIYPNATGVRAITVHSNGLNKWMEFQEAIVVNQPGTLPHENIETGAVSVANIAGQHKTFYWNEDGAPEFDESPPGANIFTINLKSQWKPFAFVAPPDQKGNLITPYSGHGRGSIFNWWDHWPVSQDASDGRGARSALAPSHSSLCHIALQIDPPIDCWGSYGYRTVIMDSALDWTVTEWSGLNLMLDQPIDMTNPVRVSFDYADFWSSDMTISFFDTRGRSTGEIRLDESGSSFVKNSSGFNKFTRTLNLAEYNGDVNLTHISEVYFEISGSDYPKTCKLDNINISSALSLDEKSFKYLDFNLPDGALIENINLPDRPEWKAYNKGDNTITKLMIHGMTNNNIENLVPLAKNWVHPPGLKIEGDEFKHSGYDPAEMAYVIEQTAVSSQSLNVTVDAKRDAPLINPAFVIRNWQFPLIGLSVNGKKMTNGSDFRYGIETKLEGDVLIIWINKTLSNTSKISISKL